MNDSPKGKERCFQDLIEERNPQIVLFRAVEDFLPEEFKPFLVDLTFDKQTLWIKVSHPSVVQLLLWKKTAIMSELRVISASLVVKDVRFSVIPRVTVDAKPQGDVPFEVRFAPTGEVDGEVIPLENKRLKELMETLRHTIESREKRGR